MAYKRISKDPGTDIGRQLPCNVVYEDEATGTRVHLECSLEEFQTLPEKCDYPPMRTGIRHGKTEYEDTGVTQQGHLHSK